MADRQKQALAALDRVVMLLERLDGLDTAWHEATGGWTIDTRASWLQRFGDLRSRIETSGDIEHESTQLVRALENDGIVGGDVADAVADLQWRLERLRDQRSKRAADGR